jgi:hypothetical protein
LLQFPPHFIPASCKIFRKNLGFFDNLEPF